LGKQLTLDQMFAAVENQILVGKTYLKIANGLLAVVGEWDVFGVAPTFFGLTAQGDIELAQMAIARLYDRGERAVTIKAMLFRAARQLGDFQAGDRQQVNAAILKSAQRVITLQPVLDAIRQRRDKWLAHLDETTVRDPDALTASAKLTREDLERAFEETEGIYSDIERLFSGIVGKICFLGGDDYNALLKCVRRATAAKEKTLAAALGRTSE
jgi:AbiU2